MQSPCFRGLLYINYLSLTGLSVVPMVVYISLALALVLVMINMPDINHCTWNMQNPDYQGMPDKIPWLLIYSMGKKRSVSGTQDWGKRSGPARPLRLGKRGFKITNMNPEFRGLRNNLKPHSFFGF